MNVSSIVVLVGLGGAGKSQLTLNYIRTHRTEYDAVFWVDARLRESLERDYIQIARLLYGGERKHEDVDQAVTAIKTWFAGRKGRWLFIYDNADSLEDEKDLYYVDLQRYLPDLPGVEIIITSRSQISKGMTELEAVDVGKLTHAEAVDLLLCCSKLGNADTAVREEAAKIVAELDYLALAVTLAGAYVAATPRIRSDISRYLPEYRKGRKKLLGRKAKKQIDQYSESVLSTWETSVATLAQQCPAAVQLLSLFAFLDPEDIYRDLLRRLAVPSPAVSDTAWVDGVQYFVSEVVMLLKDDLVVDEALEALSTYSLIQWKEEQDGYSMHKLVHAWGFDRLGANEQKLYVNGSLILLYRFTKDSELDPAEKRRITPHISSSVTRLREWHDGSIQLPAKGLDIIRLLAIFMRDTGQFVTEFELRAFEEAERSRTKDQDEIGWLISLAGLAGTLKRQGKYVLAETMLRRVLERLEKLLGAEHPQTLVIVDDIAMTLAQQGRHGAAQVMARCAVEGMKKALGEEHSDTFSSMRTLVMVQLARGKYEEAEAMAWRMFEGKKKALGEEHPDMRSSMSTLVKVQLVRGKYEEAEAMAWRVFEREKNALGEEHPATLSSILQLGSLLCATGRDKLAATMTRRALEGSERALGGEHPDTLRRLWSHASVLTLLGQRNEAISLYERASAGLAAALGEQHPDTIQCQREYEAIKLMYDWLKYYKTIVLALDLIRLIYWCWCFWCFWCWRFRCAQLSSS